MPAERSSNTARALWLFRPLIWMQIFATSLHWNQWKKDTSKCWQPTNPNNPMSICKVHYHWLHWKNDKIKDCLRMEWRQSWKDTLKSYVIWVIIMHAFRSPIIRNQHLLLNCCVFLFFNCSSHTLIFDSNRHFDCLYTARSKRTCNMPYSAGEPIFRPSHTHTIKMRRQYAMKAQFKYLKNVVASLGLIPSKTNYRTTYHHGETFYIAKCPHSSSWSAYNVKYYICILCRHR